MSKSKSTDEFAAYNYCLSFINILGQREMFKGDGCLPDASSTVLEEKLRRTVGRVIALRKRALEMVSGIVDAHPDCEFRLRLGQKERLVWDEMQKTRIRTQHWSDGLASYVCLGDQDVCCPMNSLYGLFMSAGAFCLTGLAMGQPVRGAIELAWGIEIHPGELHGPVVAQAYELESQIAQVPRIVIGQRVLQLLEGHAWTTGDDAFTRLNRQLAQLCLRMVGKDIDGVPTLHYLGQEFRDSVSKAEHGRLYRDALTFIESERSRFRDSGDQKLALRYGLLELYFKGAGVISRPSLHC